MKNLITLILFSTFGGSLTYFLIDNFNKSEDIILPIVHDSKEKIEKPEFKLTKNSQNINYELDFTSAAQKTVNAVVHIKSEYDQAYHSDPLLDYFWGPKGSRGLRPSIATGSGVIISEDGYIVTNNHVIDDAYNIIITLNDGRELEAELVGSDPNTDLALLKIDEKNLLFTEFGNSDDVNLGDWVLAVGNPFNLTSTVTAGIVSAKSRNINILRSNSKDNIFPLESFIQTDAAVNPGNSGGALVTPEGLLVGINTAIASKTGSYSGYSFAIPSNIALKVVNDLKKYGLVQRAFIGVVIQDVTQNIMNELELPNTMGVLVSGLSDGGAAKAAGIKINDVILKVENTFVNDVPELQEQIGKYKPGDLVNIIIQRKGKKKSLTLTLRNENGNTKIINNKQNEEKSIIFGAHLKDINEKKLRQLGLTNGVEVISINEGKFEEIGIEKGFIITHVNKKAVESKIKLIATIKDKKGGILIEGQYPNGVRGYFGMGL